MAADPAQEEVARSLGLGRLRTFWTVTVGQARLAIFGGAILVGLVVLAEFGAFEILGYQTLTTEIYNEFQVGFNQPAACALSLILVLLGAVLLASEDTVRGHGRTARLGAGAARELRPLALGRLRLVAFGGLGLLVALALGVPVGAIVSLLLQGGSSTLPAAASLPEATLNTFGYAAAAGVVATLAAVPIALLSVRFPSRKVLSLERSNLVVLAVPGLVIALSLAYVTEHFLQGRFYQTSPLLVLTYAIMFFPLAVVAVRAAVARAPVGLEEVAGSLGVSRRSVVWRVTLPLMGPGLVAAFALVFLETATELTATLVLHPTNVRDAGHPVLGLRVERVVFAGSPVCGRHGAHCRRAGLCARSLVRPPTGPNGWGRPERPGSARRIGADHNGVDVKDLRIAGVTKAFGPQPVLRGVDLVVPAGSFTAILGSSGSGKTTLLRIVAGFERPDDGEITMGGELIDDAGRRIVPSERRRIGYVPQEGALFPHLSVGRNVAFGLPRGPDRRRRVDELLELVGLSGYRRRFPHQLSGGQQQRVALARALAIGPEVVLLDEPFSSLDAAMRSSVRSDVHAVLRQAGTTSILVTHDQDEALSMADQVAVLRHGVIAQLDTPAELYGRPRDVDLAQFLGESNVLDGEVHGGMARTDLGELSVAAGNGSVPAGRARVMVRPEQIRLEDAPNGGVVATVQSYEYYGHDAVVRVRPEGTSLPDLVVRVTGGVPLEPGRRVGLSVRGTVVVWPWEAEIPPE